MTVKIFRVATILIATFFLLFGLVRLGVGTGMLGQELGWWTLGGEFPEALAEARAFLAEHADGAMFPWSPAFYFGLIVAMGAVLVPGAALYLTRRRPVGLALIAVYLGLHAGMFVNYQLVNPKIWLLAATVAMWSLLLWRHRADRAASVAVTPPTG